MKHLLPTIAAYLLIFTVTCSIAHAQHGPHMPDPIANLRKADKQRLDDQAKNIFTAAKPAVTTAAKSTVAISYRHHRIAYGTVINIPGSKHPAILTKWSEISRRLNRLMITTPEGNQHPAKVTGIYPKHDLALLSTPETKLTPLNLKASSSPALGNFILMPEPSGNVRGFGVVSVSPRSLREHDKAYLGVMMDFSAAKNDGVPVKQVIRGSAASVAGLRDGDTILAINNKPVTGAMEMRNLLQRLIPGSKVTIRYRRGTTEHKTTANLGSRADVAGIQRVPRERMEHMQRMGTTPNRVRGDFPNVIQSDMPIKANDAGAPVTDLDGNIVGIAIARASRIKTFIIPTSTLLDLLSTKPKSARTTITRNNKENRHTTGRRIPSDEDPIDKVRRLLDKVERNNDANAENLRKIEDALRDLSRPNQRGFENNR